MPHICHHRPVEENDRRFYKILITRPPKYGQSEIDFVKDKFQFFVDMSKLMWFDEKQVVDSVISLLPVRYVSKLRHHALNHPQFSDSNFSSFPELLKLMSSLHKIR